MVEHTTVTVTGAAQHLSGEERRVVARGAMHRNLQQFRTHMRVRPWSGVVLAECAVCVCVCVCVCV